MNSQSDSVWWSVELSEDWADIWCEWDQKAWAWFHEHNVRCQYRSDNQDSQQRLSESSKKDFKLFN